MNQKHGNISKLRNVALAMVLTVGVGAPSYAALAQANGDGVQSAQAAENNDSTSTDSLQNALDKANKATATDTISTKQSKEESVFLLSQANGDVKQTIVSDWLHNVNKDQKLSDVSDLSDIQNTESDAGYTKSGDGQKLTWDANGDDVYYQGTTDKQAPIGMKVTYKLDGQEVSPDDIAGKSGKVEIRYDFTNNTGTKTTVDGQEQTVYTPFACITGLVLDNDNFKNVVVENGRSVNDGDHTTVAGLALPGMQEDLGLSKDTIDIPDHFTVTADVTDFKLANTGTIVTNDALNGVDTDDLDSMSVDEQVDQLQSAMQQLMDGSSELTDGLQQLSDGAGELDAGLGQLQDSTAALPSSADALASGSSQLAAGIQSAYSGSAQLGAGIDSAASGTDQLSDAASQVNSGLRTLKYGSDTSTGLTDAVDAVKQLHTGTGSLLQGLQLMQTQVNDTNSGLPALQAGASELNQGLTDGKTQLDGALADDGQIMSGIDTMQNGADETATMIDELPDQAKSMLQMGAGVADAAGNAAGQAKTDSDAAKSSATDANKDVTDAYEELIQMYDGLSDTEKAALGQDRVDKIEDAKAKLQSAQKATSDAATSAGQASSSAQSSQMYSTMISGTLKGVDIEDNQAYKDAKSKTQQLQSGLAQLKGGLGQVKSQSDTSLSAAIAGSQQLADGVGQASTQINAGLAQLLQGCSTVENGLYAVNNGGTTASGKTSKGLNGALDAIGDENTSGTLLYGTNAIVNGTGSLSDGMGQLQAGSGQLTSGLGTAVSGADQLAAGTQQLADSAPALVDGVDQLKSGSSQLASGADSAVSGSQQLQDGLTQFNDQAVQKIVDAYNNNVKGLSSRIKATVNAGKAYDNFSGKDRSMAGSVKFIIETDSINMD